jgi:GNAT superfamily N-acetyltransferase
VTRLRVVTEQGAGLRRHLADIARLRIAVFRAWPYLYDGSAEFEQRYLQTYVDTPDAMVALCFAGDRIVGASTALPLMHETEEITRPFGSSTPAASANAAGVVLENTLYLGESVLDPAWRGHGIGVEFFRHREAHAARLGLAHCVFCAVQRQAEDPRRPPDHQPLDAFWRKRGYLPLDGVTTTLRWQELGETGESPKPMQFFHKRMEV